MKDGSLLLQGAPQFVGIGQVPVVRQSHAALIMVDQQRLDVPDVVCPGRCIAHMSDHDVAGSKGLQPLSAEHFADQAHVAASAEHTVTVQHDPGALLSSMLERMKTAVSQRGQISVPRRIDTENAALLMDVLHRFPLRHRAHTGGP